MRCSDCSKPIFRQEITRCCRKMSPLCLVCADRLCKQCKRKASEKPVNPKKQSYELLGSQKIRKCAMCRLNFDSFNNEIFVDKKCGHLFCFKDMLKLYEHYSQIIQTLEKTQGIKPEMPVELPCNCEYPEDQIVAFLQKSCSICLKKIQVRQLTLSDKLKIDKSCFESAKHRAQKLSAVPSQKVKYKELMKKIISCSSCNEIISEIGGQIDEIFFCKHCYHAMTANQQLYHKEKERDKEIELKRRPRIQCTNCSKLFKTLDRDQRICDVCKQFEVQPQRKAKQEKREEKKQQNWEKVSDSHDVSKRKQIKEHKVQNAQIQREKQRQKQKEKDDPKYDIKQEKFIKKDSQLSWEGKNYQNPNSYELPLRINHEQFWEKCDQCLILFEATEVYKAYLRDEKDKSTIRIIETKQEEEQHAKKIQLFCSLCYLTMKADLTRQKKRKYDERFSRSVPKREKQPSYQPKTVMASKKDPFSFDSPSSEVGALINNRLHQSPTLQKRCKNCFKMMQINYQKTFIDVCQDCRALKEGKGEKCMNCSKVKRELKRPPYCLECWNIRTK